MRIGAQSQSPTRSPDADAQRANVRTIAESLKRGEPHDTELPVPKGWRPTRTVWGDPDIEGVYTNIDESGIPFERTSQFDGRLLESITSAELARLRAERRDAFLERLATGEPAEPGTIGWYDNLNAKGSRAWLIVDPPDGRIPPLTPPVRRERRPMPKGRHGDVERIPMRIKAPTRDAFHAAYQVR